MDREGAKRELAPLKDLSKDIQSVGDEIERLMTIATKMTTSFDPINITGTPKNRMEEAMVKLDDYRKRLSNLLLETIDYKNRCLDKIVLIEPKSLQKILLYYYFQNLTLEKTAEMMDKSYQWTYELYLTALDKYAEISST